MLWADVQGLWAAGLQRPCPHKQKITIDTTDTVEEQLRNKKKPLLHSISQVVVAVA